MSPRPSFGWETFWVALYRLLADRPAIGRPKPKSHVKSRRVSSRAIFRLGFENPRGRVFVIHVLQKRFETCLSSLYS